MGYRELFGFFLVQDGVFVLLRQRFRLNDICLMRYCDLKVYVSISDNGKFDYYQYFVLEKLVVYFENM